MLRKILIFGVIGGIIAGAPMVLMTVFTGGKMLLQGGQLMGYATMLVALSTVFIAIKRRRDIDGGGVIRFWPALGLGLGITLVASLLYAVAWELAQSLSEVDFMTLYANAQIEALKARGASAATIAAESAKMAAAAEWYKNPLLRFPLTMTEILPVGLLVSIVSAALLRNSRFLPARATA
jgi:hypothetical protein